MEYVLLTRHAESEASVVGLTNGDPSREIGLTALGCEQARRLAERLAAVQIDLCAVSEFKRAQETADIALAGRDIPRLVLAGLNDIRFGEFEGQPLSDYRRWARAHGPEDVVPGGDSRAATVRRYAEAFRTLLARPDGTILVVAHSLPVRYALDAAAGTLPAPAVEQIPYAEPFELDADQLSGAVAVLERWASAPAWR